jgi:uracil-DNA glycosylase
MNAIRELRDAKLARLSEPHAGPLTALVDRWRAEGRPVPYPDPDLGGVYARILFLHESPGPKASMDNGSGLISPDNADPSARRFWRLSRDARLPRDAYISWNVVPWYVSATGKNQNATSADAQAALPYLHEFIGLLPELRVVVLMGRFAQQWWPRYLIACRDAPVLRVLAAPHPSDRAGIGNPGQEPQILSAMTRAAEASVRPI